MQNINLVFGKVTFSKRTSKYWFQKSKNKNFDFEDKESREQKYFIDSKQGY